MRGGTGRRAGRAVLALLVGLLAGVWVGGGLVWVFNRGKFQEAAGRVADVSLAPAEELALVPADAAGFVHVRAADLWKTEAVADYRRVLGKAGDDALRALDEGFSPAPSTLDRVTVIGLAPPPPAKGRGGPKDDAPAPGVDAVAVLTFSAPFDLAKVREANLPKAQKVVVGDSDVWADDSGVALSARGDRTLVVGRAPAVRALLLSAKTPDGPLTPALKLAAAGSRHVVGGLNLKAFPLPADFKKSLPPEVVPVLRAEALALGVVVGRGVRLDLRAAYKDDASAEEAEKQLRKSAEAGRKSLEEAKAKMLTAVAGREGGPKPRPAADLPEAVGGLFALGTIATLDEWLDKLPLVRTGPELSADVTVESVGGAYAAAAVGLLLPAVEKVRTAAARTSGQANLRQLAVAMHLYHDTHGRFPAAGLTSPPNAARGKALLSWRVAVLPFIGEQALHGQFKLDEPWDGPNNIKLLPRMPRAFASVGAPAPPGKTRYQVFVAPDNSPVRTLFGRTQGRNLAAAPDGAMSTIMIAEATNPVDWTKPEDLTLLVNGPIPPLGLPGAPGFNAAMGDGMVRYFPHTVPANTLRALIGADDGEVVPDN
jgi:hypothetical protein